MPKNITLSADASLIQRARDQARRNKTTLNQLFRDWLARYVGIEHAEERYSELMEHLSYAEAGGPFSREEMNER